MEWLSCGFRHHGCLSESDSVLKNQMLNTISLPLNVACKYMSVLSWSTDAIFRNVPLTTNWRSLRNMFSHLVRKNIRGEIQDCKLHLELTIKWCVKICFPNIAEGGKTKTQCTIMARHFQQQFTLLDDCKSSRFNQWSMLPFTSACSVCRTSLTPYFPFYTQHTIFARNYKSTQLLSDDGLPLTNGALKAQLRLVYNPCSPYQCSPCAKLRGDINVNPRCCRLWHNYRGMHKWINMLIWLPLCFERRWFT